MNAARLAAVALVVALAVALPPAAATENSAAKAILYTRSGTEEEECGSIWSVDPDGGAPAPVIDRGDGDCDPDWAPDGQRFAFASHRGAAQAIYIADATGAILARVSHPPAGATDYMPAWSPGGKQIAFERRTPRGSRFELYVVRADGSHERRIAGGHGFDGTPSWSRDGRVVYVSDRPHGQKRVCPSCSALYVERLGSNQAGRITSRQFNALMPAWSPNGKEIAWSRGTSVNDDIMALYVMRANTTGARLIDVAGVTPAWSPDSRAIVFSSGSGLVVVNADGTGGRRLTIDGGDGPSWRTSPP